MEAKKKTVWVNLGITVVLTIWALSFASLIPSWDMKWRLAGSVFIAVLFLTGAKWIGRKGKRFADQLNRTLDGVNIIKLLGGAAGLFAGILTGALSTIPFATFKAGGSYLAVGLFGVFGIFGLVIGYRRAPDILKLYSGQKLGYLDGQLENPPDLMVLDTSAIIDGRIYDVCLSNFLKGTIVVPTFVIKELQHIADSSDSIRRSKGRRGLDILSKMQKHTDIKVDIMEASHIEDKEVDARLVKLCKTLGASIITNDYNLNKVAELQGITVLNINELTNAVKVMVFPGENMHIAIIKEGKEAGQGIGYLEDGTMVVVEDAMNEIGHEVEVVVTSVFQTAAGRMIFTRKSNETADPVVLGKTLPNIKEVNMYG